MRCSSTSPRSHFWSGSFLAGAGEARIEVEEAWRDLAAVKRPGERQEERPEESPDERPEPVKGGGAGPLRSADGRTGMGAANAAPSPTIGQIAKCAFDVRLGRQSLEYTYFRRVLKKAVGVIESSQNRNAPVKEERQNPFSVGLPTRERLPRRLSCRPPSPIWRNDSMSISRREFAKSRSPRPFGPAVSACRCRRSPRTAAPSSPQRARGVGRLGRDAAVDQEETGISVPVDNKNSGQSVSRIPSPNRRTRWRTPATWRVSFAINAKNQGLVENYKGEGWNRVPDGLKDPDGAWVSIHAGTIGLMVNVEALDGLPVPKSWNDLLDPKYEGLVGFLDPSSAFVGYACAMAVNQAMGGSLDNFQPALDYFKKLRDNSPIVPKQTAHARCLSGEIPILFDYDFAAYRAKHVDGAPIEFVIPAEGTIQVP